MLDFLGVTEHFSCMENTPFSFPALFRDMAGEAVSLDGVIFSGSIVSANQEVVEISIEKGEPSNEVIFHSPPCLKEDGLTMSWFRQMMVPKEFCFPGIFPYSVFLVSHSWQAVRQ